MQSVQDKTKKAQRKRGDKRVQLNKGAKYAGMTYPDTESIGKKRNEFQENWFGWQR